jgi:hypothetical protein
MPRALDTALRRSARPFQSFWDSNAKLKASRLRADVVGQIGVPPGRVRLRRLHYEPVKIPYVTLRYWPLFAGQIPDLPDGVVMIERFKVILQWLPGDRDSLLDDKRRFDRREGVPLDRIRSVGDFYVVVML